MKVFGYVRVSTKEQNEARQVEALKPFGIGERELFIEKASGKDFSRPQYQALKTYMRKGDVLYIKSIDRLGRNKDMIKDELEWFKQNGIRLKVVDMPTTMQDIAEGQEWILDMVNNILIEVYTSIAQQERETTRQRQAEGIAIAKERGVYKGRPTTNKVDAEFIKVYDQWKAKQISAVKAMELLKLKKTTFYKLVKDHEGGNQS